MTGKDDKDRDIVDLFNSLAEGAEKMKEIADENEDLINDFFGGGSSTKIDDPEPLRESHITEDSVKIVAEVSDDGFQNMGVKFKEGELMIEAGEDKLVAQVPNDIIKDSVDAKLNNGVLIVEMDREDDEIDPDTVVEVDNDIPEGEGVPDLDDLDEEGGDDNGSDG